MVMSWQSASGPLLFGHRGASIERPENTIASFERALQLGVDVLELDVHATRDGVFAVSHDATGERMCNVKKAFRDCTWAEVSDWDAGWGFVDAAGQRPYAGRGVRLARLERLLAEFSSLFNVDVKQASFEQVANLVKLVRAEKAEERVLFTSFSGRTVSRLRRAGYRGPLGLSRPDAVRLLLLPRFIQKALGFAGTRAQLPPTWGPFALGSARFIERGHRLGLGMDYWVINERQQAEELLSQGADGIITDDPATIAEAFRVSPKTGAWRRRHSAP